MSSTDLEFLPEGPPEQLMVLLHGVGADAAHLAPLARVLRTHFPRAAVLVPQGFEPFDLAPSGRQWFSVAGVTEQNRPARVAAALPRLLDWLHAAQARLQASQAATALVGFSQGSIMALEAIAREDGLAGRVLAFSGRYASLPAQAPQLTTIHLLHGADDAVMPVELARQAFEHLADLPGGDVTLDIADGVGHELHAALVEQALHQLTHHIPLRTWQAALGSAPAGGVH
ncbi:MAG: esterase [Leptothrix sp. (in: b-proteobacteria)]